MAERSPIDKVFAALSDPTRRDLFRAATAKGPLTTSELADGRAMSRQAVAKHLNVLVDAGLLKGTATEAGTSFEPTKRALNPATKWLKDVEKVQERRAAKAPARGRR
jgi:DNA-binding transcriptional ArsR family regulator